MRITTHIFKAPTTTVKCWSLKSALRKSRIYEKLGYTVFEDFGRLQAEKDGEAIRFVWC